MGLLNSSISINLKIMSTWTSNYNMNLCLRQMWFNLTVNNRHFDISFKSRGAGMMTNYHCYPN